MSKRIKTLIMTLVIATMTSTGAMAAPINTTNTFDGDRGNDVVTQSDGTETQYYQDYFGTIFNNLPRVTKTVTQGEAGNTLKYQINLISGGGGADVEHHILDTTSLTVNNIERESGFGIERLLYSTKPVTVTMQGTQLFKSKQIQKCPKYVMDNGSLAYAELNGDSSKYPVSTLDTGLSTYELKDPGLYLVMFDKLDIYGATKGIHFYVYIAQPGESITNTVTSNVAVPSTIDLNVSGYHTSVPTYLINESKYVRVRDLAYVLKGTEKQISVYHNNGTDTTTINTVAGLGNPTGNYTVIGTELSSLPSGTMQAEPSVHNLAKNGSGINPASFTIGGQDFVSLKALDSILNLGMEFYSDGIVINAPAKVAEAPKAEAKFNSDHPNYEQWTGRLRPKSDFTHQ